MSYKNLMEDIVGNVVEEVLKNDKDLNPDEFSKDDITAYVLNRIPPRYVTSERGMLHGKLNTRYATQERTDILFGIYEAIEVIKSRRSNTVSGTITGTFDSEMRQFAHIVGEVLEETTMVMIPDVEVSLLFKDRVAEMIDEGWRNPYQTHRATRGYYHFWPRYADEDMAGKKKVPFSLVFRHPKFEEKKVNIEIDLFDEQNMARSHIVPIVLLNAKEGVDLDFLYTEG